jgi:thioredoxin reductase (NADPH)
VGKSLQNEDVIIIGGGPCGLSAAISLKEIGINPLVIEKGNIVNAIYNYPTHQTFFSTSEKLEIGDVPFIIEERKPRRSQALAYYRHVVLKKDLRINAFERVMRVEKQNDGSFFVPTNKGVYHAKRIIIATGYYDNPNFMNIEGENLGKVAHYFKEGHPYFNKDVVVIGGKNSAIDAALELQKSGANVTVIYRGSTYSKSIKPWILPEFEALVKTNEIKMVFNGTVKKITETEVFYMENEVEKNIKNDFVFAMTGYRPDHQFLMEVGITIDEETGRPLVNEETMETNVSGVYIAGVIAAGNNANEIFIENGRFHGPAIARDIQMKEKPSVN